MNRPLKLLYITYHENILRSGILYTQVIRMLENMRTYNGKMQIVLLSFMSPQLLWRERDCFRSLKRRLAGSDIRLIILPMLIPASWNWFFQTIILLWVIPVLIVVKHFGCDIIHPRGYSAAGISLVISRLLGIPFLFDPRGPFPEEMVMNRRWKTSCLTFKLWKKTENRLIREAGSVIGVTPEFRDEYKNRGAARADFVPNRADVKRFAEAVSAYRTSNEFDKAQDQCELLFIGELHAVWNDPALVARHFATLSRLRSGSRLKLLTRADFRRVEGILRGHGIEPEQVIHKSGTPQEMSQLMQGARLGLIFRAVDVVSSWPVKMAEYLAAGIPLLVDRTMVGLPVDIVRKNNLGFLASPDRDDDYIPVKDIMNDWIRWSDRCIHYAQRRLDISSTSRQFLRIYRKVTAGSAKRYTC